MLKNALNTKNNEKGFSGWKSENESWSDVTNNKPKLKTWDILKKIDQSHAGVALIYRLIKKLN